MEQEGTKAIDRSEINNLVDKHLKVSVINRLVLSAESSSFTVIVENFCFSFLLQFTLRKHLGNTEKYWNVRNASCPHRQW